MKRQRPAFVLAAALLLAGGAHGGTLYLEELPKEPGVLKYRITRVDVQLTEYVRMSNYYGDYSLMHFNAGTDVCGTVNWKSCPGGPGSGVGRFCIGAANTADNARNYVGAVLSFPDGNPPKQWMHSCASSGVLALGVLYGPVVIATAPVSCTTSPVEFRLLGRVETEVTDSQNVHVNCDSKASIKLTIPDAGMVKVSGGGEVQLKFPFTGEAVRFSTGIDHLIALSAKLTKSPATAGTYTGSTVLLLDVL